MSPSHQCKVWMELVAEGGAAAEQLVWGAPGSGSSPPVHWYFPHQQRMFKCLIRVARISEPSSVCDLRNICFIFFICACLVTLCRVFSYE